MSSRLIRVHNAVQCPADKCDERIEFNGGVRLRRTGNSGKSRLIGDGVVTPSLLNEVYIGHLKSGRCTDRAGLIDVLRGYGISLDTEQNSLSPQEGHGMTRESQK